MPRKKVYRVLVGMDYGDVRREPNDLADDIPAKSVKSLLAQKAIEPVEDGA